MQNVSVAHVNDWTQITQVGLKVGEINAQLILKIWLEIHPNKKLLAFYPPLIGPKALIILNTQIKVWVTKDPNLNPNKFIENLSFTYL